MLAVAARTLPFPRRGDTATSFREHQRIQHAHECQVQPLCSMQGLRLHDNPALQQAISEADTLVPVFCLDPWFITSGTVGAARINFLLQSLQNLDDNLQKRNGRLIVLHGDPKDVLPGAAKALGITHAYFEKDTEPYALTRDRAVSGALHEMGIEVCSSA